MTNTTMTNIRHHENSTENTKVKITLPNTITLKNLFDLSNELNGAVLKYDDKLLFTGVAFCDYIGAVYKFIDTEPDAANWHKVRLSLVTMSNEGFEDGGHAIEWAMKQ